MSNICKSKEPHNVGRMRTESFVLLMGALLAGGCGGGGSDSPPASPAPPPSVPSPPPPPPAPTVPPLSSTIVSLENDPPIGIDQWPVGDTATGGQGAPVLGMDCIVNPPQTFHVHAHVSIFLDGVQLAVPPYVGGVPQPAGGRCYYPIHTHDRSGKIHVEAAAPGTFTLGQMFTIWGQPLESTNVAGLTGKPIKVFVTDAGVVTESTSNWGDIELTTHREITFQIGTAIAEIPNYSWSGN